MKVKKRICKICGKENEKDVTSCVFCKTSFDTRKSCPRCAKRNFLSNEKCDNCGFSFTRKSMGLVRNFLLSFFLVFVLYLFLFLHKERMVEHITLGLKIGALFLFISVLLSTFTYGKKEKIRYSAEEEMISKNLRFFKVFSRVVFVIGLFLAIGFLLYFILKDIL